MERRSNVPREGVSSGGVRQMTDVDYEKALKESLNTQIKLLFF